MSEAKCEVSEEQRAKAEAIATGIYNAKPYETLREAIAQALAQEAQRANERAEGMEREARYVRPPMGSCEFRSDGRPHHATLHYQTTACRKFRPLFDSSALLEDPDALGAVILYQGLISLLAEIDTERNEATSRAEGLAKELAEAKGERDNLKHSARVLENDRDEHAGAAQYAEDDLEKAEAQVAAATARVAELEAKLSHSAYAAQVEHLRKEQARVAELEKQLATHSARGCTCVDTSPEYCPICADRIQDLEKQLADYRLHEVPALNLRLATAEKQLGEKRPDLARDHAERVAWGETLKAANGRADAAEAELARLRHR